MECYCCGTKIKVGRKVKLRPWYSPNFSLADIDSAAFKAYLEDMTFRWTAVCLHCYRILDSWCGVGEVGAREFNIAGKSRGDKAAVVTEAKWLAFQKKEAAKLGLDLS